MGAKRNITPLDSVNFSMGGPSKLRSFSQGPLRTPAPPPPLANCIWHRFRAHSLSRITTSLNAFRLAPKYPFGFPPKASAFAPFAATARGERPPPPPWRSTSSSGSAPARTRRTRSGPPPCTSPRPTCPTTTGAWTRGTRTPRSRDPPSRGRLMRTRSRSPAGPRTRTPSRSTTSPSSRSGRGLRRRPRL